MCVCELRGRLSKRLQDSVELKSDIHCKVGRRILLCVNDTYLEANLYCGESEIGGVEFGE